MDTVDAVAAHRPYGLDCKCGRAINSDANWAQHLIDALGLTEQWGWQLGDFAPKAYGSERKARERVAELDAMFAADPDSKRHSSLKRHIVSRLVSGWVRKDNTNE